MENEKNEFEEMYNKDDFNSDQSNDFVQESVVSEHVEEESTQPLKQSNEQTLEEKDEEIGVGNYDLVEYIKTPDVGQSIEFTVKKIVNVKDKSKHVAFNSNTGEEFVVGVKRKDGTTIRLDVITDEDKVFTLNSWATFMLFQAKNGAFANEVRKRGTLNGIKVKLTRNYDGSVPNKKDSDVMKLYDLSSIEEAIAYKKKVAEAMKNNNLLKLEIIEDSTSTPETASN